MYGNKSSFQYKYFKALVHNGNGYLNIKIINFFFNAMIIN